MRSLLILAAVTCIIVAAQGPPVDASKTKASISGIIQDAGSGAPIADAQVHARRSPAESSRDIETKSDSHGRYTFADLDPGEYRLYVYGPNGDRPGFGAFAEKSITVASGQELTSVDVSLRTRGTISGRVIDENKEPVPGASVFLIAREYSLGALRHVFAGMAATDDQGQYTISRVDPGRGCFLMVRQQRQLPAISEAPDDPKLRKRVNAQTFYPDALSLNAAQPITVRVGEKREGVDLRILRAPSLCVEGVLQARGAPVPMNFTIGDANVTSGLSGNGGFFMSEPGGRTANDGKIRICELAPGEYRISTWVAGETAFGVIPVTVVDRDVKNLIASAPARVPLGVEIVWDGPAPEPPVAAELVVQLNPRTRAFWPGEFNSERSKVPGQFVVPNMFVDEYVVLLHGLPATLYVKAISYGDADLLHEPLRVGTAMGNATLRIVIARDGGIVTARTVDKDGNPVADTHVLLIPVRATSEAMLADMFVSGQTDQSGMWKSNALAPGKYLAIATPTPVNKSPESIAKLWNARTHAQELELTTNGSAQVTISPRPLD